jgi:hypothetical protein
VRHKVQATRRWASGSTRASAPRRPVRRSARRRSRLTPIASASAPSSDAFGEGRLTSIELDERTTRALASRTHGELEDVLDGLGGPGAQALWATRPERGIVPRIVFWVVGLFISPFVFFGTMLLIFGDDMGDRVAGIVMLVIFLPGLIALYRWAHPRG